MWTETMQAFVVLGVGFFVARLLAEGLRRWGLLHGGALFVGLGVLVGPSALGVLDPAALAELAPAAGIAIGWVGLQAGLAVSARRDGGLAEGALRAGLFYVFTMLLLVGVAIAALLWVLDPTGFGLDLPALALAAAVAAAAAVAGSPASVRRVARRFGASGPVSEAGESLARVARAAGLLSFAIALAFHGRPAVDGLRPLAPTEWLLAEVAVGVILGVAADSFLGEEPDDRRLFVGLAAISVFATGLSWHLRLSPVLINLVIGLTLANVGHREPRHHRVVTILETPTLHLLLLYAGAVWEPRVDTVAWALLAGLVVARLLMAVFAGSVAARALDPANPGLRRMGFMLLGQGAPAVAVAISWWMMAPSDAGQLLLTAIVGAVVLNDLWAGPAARVVLDEAGEIPALRTES
ncbi:MAG: hypothetical protein ACQEXJ_14610 [Myxococcota bacterium]